MKDWKPFQINGTGIGLDDFGDVLRCHGSIEICFDQVEREPYDRFAEVVRERFPDSDVTVNYDSGRVRFKVAYRDPAGVTG